jgi:hypothetical protein
MEGGDTMFTDEEKSGDRLLSEEISKQVNEAKRLLELKAELGRLPKSARITSLAEAITVWFDSVSPVSTQRAEDSIRSELEDLGPISRKIRLRQLLKQELDR